MARYSSKSANLIDFDSTKRKTKPVKPKVDNISLKRLEAITEAQREMLTSCIQGQNVVAYGSAGTGKTYIAISYALQEIFAKRKNKIVLVRSAVPTRSVGYLPGDMDEKTQIYTAPFKQIVNDVCNCDTAYGSLTHKGVIEFMTTSFIRGITLDDCIIIADEFQDFNWHEICSLVTRSGMNTQLIFCGDNKQNDLITSKNDVSGFDTFMRVIGNMKEFDVVRFFPEDIVRSGLVKSFIMECERQGV